jgi:multimeric flavodoxin WrbA
VKPLIAAVALLVLAGPASAGTLKHDMRTFMERAHEVYVFWDLAEDRGVDRDDPAAKKTYEQMVHKADEAYTKLARHKPYCAYKNGSMGVAIGRCIGKRIYWLKPGSWAAKYVEKFSKAGVQE